MTYIPTWTLDTCLDLKTNLKKYIADLQKDLHALHLLLQNSQKIQEQILQWQEISCRLHDLASLALCQTAQDVRDESAIQLEGTVKVLEAELKSAGEVLDKNISSLDDAQFAALCKLPAILPISMPIEERRAKAKEKMNEAQETLAASLAIDGYHGWKQIYDVAIGNMEIEIVEEGVHKRVSCGQAYNFLSHPSRAVRHEVFTKWESACSNQEALFSQILNHMAGFRLELYNKRGWNMPIKESLNLNRLQEKTVMAMWEAVDQNRPSFTGFLEAKAKTMGLSCLSWYDLEAPFGKINKTFSYQDAASLTIDYFSRFSEKMADFAKIALSNKWVDAEDRPHKAPGGFCTPFCGKKESRIFMTFSNTLQNFFVLAHELGHAFHSHVLFDLPPLVQSYPMSLAECASTVAEQIVTDGLLAESKTPEERLSVFHDRALRSVIFFCNIHARFQFEKEFYKERKDGLITPAKLCSLMQQAQEKAYGKSLESYHPYFWITKVHFYLTDLPNYNFPYTFGYLLSLAIYAKARENKEWFQDWYIPFLQDTGRMTCEELIQKHFGQDAATPQFWQKALDIAKEDIDEFLKLCKQLKKL